MSKDLDELVHTLTWTKPKTLRSGKVIVQVVGGKDKGVQQEFSQRIRIGSTDLSDLVLQDPMVSGVHCELTVDNEVRVHDLGSKNGTFLGNYRVNDAIVPSGEVLRIGQTRIRVTPTQEMVELPLLDATELHGIVGRSAAMRTLMARIEPFAHSKAPVLIEGETGTGKENVAEALHLSSPRAEGPLVIVDVGSIPHDRFEAELLGVERSMGAFERAHGGTLFIEDIGEVPLEAQSKLLRLIEATEIRRLGGNESIAVDARIVAATRHDLALETSRGRFRADLYHRVSALKLNVPPLRERLEDLPLLAIHLLKEMGVDPTTVLTVDSLAGLAEHDWPGNVRELKNVLEQAALLQRPARPESGRAASPSGHLPLQIDTNLPMREAKQRLIEELERTYISALLKECRGNISKTAKRAGMDRMSIYRMLQRLGLNTGS